MSTDSYTRTFEGTVADNSDINYWSYIIHLSSCNVMTDSSITIRQKKANGEGPARQLIQDLRDRKDDNVKVKVGEDAMECVKPIKNLETGDVRHEPKGYKAKGKEDVCGSQLWKLNGDIGEDQFVCIVKE